MKCWHELTEDEKMELFIEKSETKHFTDEPEMIPISECKHGYLYFVNMRNGRVGVYNEDQQGFLFIRHKWGHEYSFVEIHWEADKHYGTASPFIEIGESDIEPRDYDIKGSGDQEHLKLVLAPYIAESIKFEDIKEKRWAEKYREEHGSNI